jgi:dTDP-4-amino-4,6-dideoxygalactose transaminase
MILFNDFNWETRILKDEINGAIQKVLDSGYFILGKELEAFENNFAGYTGCRYCVGVASGTEAIALALMAHGVGAGDEVITTNLTAYPTITGIRQSGAKPVVVDIDSSNGLIDHHKIREKITKQTKAIVPVHLYGQSCDLDEIKDIALKSGLLVIEDCAQSAGATYKNKKCGSLADCGAFSFYPTKTLGGYGDGGAVTTNNEEIYTKLIALRNYGQTKRYYHDLEGINSRLDELQASILNVKLKYLDQWNEIRQEIAANYRDHLSTVECLREENYGKPVNHLFVVKSEHRDKLMEFLREKGIQTLIHYPVPVNRQKAFAGQKDEVFENSDKLAAAVVSLPIYPGLNKMDLSQIIKTINEFRP